MIWIDIEKNLDDIRSDFSIGEAIFLRNCRISLPPKSTVEAAHNFIEKIKKGPEPLLRNKREREAIKEAANLIGAEEKEIAFIHSTSEGTAAAAKMIDFSPNDNVIISDMEFMSNVIPWKIMEGKEGIEVRVVENQGGRFSSGDIENKMDSHTKVISLSSVQECNGFRCELKKIGKLAEENDSYFIVDTIQQLGAIKLNVKEINADIMAAGGAKWLLNPFGAGIFYMDEKHIDSLDPVYLGWSNVKQPEDGWYDVLSAPNYSPIKDYEIRTDTARKYSLPITDIEVGKPALASSLSYINNIGIKNIEKRILNLTDILIENLDKDRVEISSPIKKREERSGIISIRTENDSKVVKELEDRNIFVSLSYASGEGGIRISPHFFNTEEEILTCCREIDKITNNL